MIVVISSDSQILDEQVFDKKVIEAVRLATKESHRLGHNFVGTEQILVGIVEEVDGSTGSTASS